MQPIPGAEHPLAYVSQKRVEEGGDEDARRTVAEILESGKSFLKEGKYTEALAEFGKVLQLDTGNREALRLQGEAQFKMESRLVEKAREEGALSFFGEKYGEEVRVVKIGDESKELCGGTHVDNTSQIELVKVVSESSVASGIRRIEAVTGENAREWLKKTLKSIRSSSVLQHSKRSLSGSLVVRWEVGDEPCPRNLRCSNDSCVDGCGVGTDGRSELRGAVVHD